MTREIKDLQPDYYRDIYEFDKIAKVQEDNFKDFDDFLVKQLSNLYVSQSDEDAISNFEKVYGITPSSNDSIDSRRRRIISKLLPPQAITISFFKKMLKNMDLDVRSNVDAVNGVYQLIVDYDQFSGSQLDELEELLNSYVPANLNKVIYRYQKAESDLGNYLGIANTVRLYSHADYVKE